MKSGTNQLSCTFQSWLSFLFLEGLVSLNKCLLVSGPELFSIPVCLRFNYPFLSGSDLSLVLCGCMTAAGVVICDLSLADNLRSVFGWQSSVWFWLAIFGLSLAGNPLGMSLAGSPLGLQSSVCLWLKIFGLSLADHLRSVFGWQSSVWFWLAIFCLSLAGNLRSIFGWQSVRSVFGWQSITSVFGWQSSVCL